MPQIEGLYVVEFGDVAIGGQTYTYWNGGVAVLETNRIFGGDSGYYYVGNYTIKDSQFEATVKIVKHSPTWEDAFGSTSPSFKVKVQATSNNGIIEGFRTRPHRPRWRIRRALGRRTGPGSEFARRRAGSHTCRRESCRYHGRFRPRRNRRRSRRRRNR